MTAPSGGDEEMIFGAGVFAGLQDRHRCQAAGAVTGPCGLVRRQFVLFGIAIERLLVEGAPLTGLQDAAEPNRYAPSVVGHKRGLVFRRLVQRQGWTRQSRETGQQARRSLHLCLPPLCLLQLSNVCLSIRKTIGEMRNSAMAPRRRAGIIVEG